MPRGFWEIPPAISTHFNVVFLGEGAQRKPKLFFVINFLSSSTQFGIRHTVDFCVNCMFQNNSIVTSNLVNVISANYWTSNRSLRKASLCFCPQESSHTGTSVIQLITLTSVHLKFLIPTSKCCMGSKSNPLRNFLRDI